MLHKFFGFIKKEIVLCVAGVLAIATAFVVHPSKAYIGYIDFRVLALLFALMLVVAGLKEAGIFVGAIRLLVRYVKSHRVLELILVYLCFFSGMIITNDVALITFVPFAIELLMLTGRKKYLIYIIVLQTIAANLGSMVTPIGNPQNLYLYTTFNMSMGDFFTVMLPYAIAAFVLITVAVCVLPSGKIEAVNIPPSEPELKGKWRLAVIFALFAVCIACVARVLDYRIMLAVVIVGIAAVNYRLFAGADYFLLLTFVAFFIMTGNIKSITGINDFLSKVVSGNEIPVSIISSQVISNVPAAVLLSGFTDDVSGLLIGVNIGGLGTLIASMASLISFRIYGGIKDAAKGKYLMVFTGMSLLFLAVMLLIVWIV